MKKRIAFLCIAFSQFALGEQCKIESNNIWVNYQKTTMVKNVESHKAETFSLIRNNNSVAHVSPQVRQVDLWHRVRGNNVMLTRFFTDVKQAIEYQPQEIKSGVSFLEKFQLLTLGFLEKLTLVEEKKYACHSEQVLELKGKQQSIFLIWQKELQLPKYLKIVEGERVVTWQQQTLSSNQEEIKQYLDQLSGYQVTDYADIGDNENNPVLAKMIYQGFTPPQKSDEVHAHESDEEHEH